MVAETVAKAYEFYRRIISNSMGEEQKIPILRRLCADDPRNWEDTPAASNYCKHCGREGKMQSQEIPIEQLIDSAAFIATAASMGTVISFHLFTSCSRLQKQAKSLASLSCDSYMDMIHQNIKQTVTPLTTVDRLTPSSVKNEAGDVTLDSEAEMLMVTEVGSDYEMVDDDNATSTKNHNTTIKEKPKDGDFETQDITDNMKEAMGMVALFNSSKFESVFNRVQLDCAALHAQMLKYDTETKFTNFKEDIQYSHNNSVCTCVNKISDFLSEIKL